MKKFTPSHEWIHIEEGKARVGITAHAQRELGEVVYIEFPQLGKRVQIGEEVVVLESTKSAADIYAPLSGEITAVNEALRNDFQSINSSPEQEGWLFEIEVEDPEELDRYLDKEAYTSLIKP